MRQISEQLRRFLDDQVWLENRRVLDLVRAIEATALEIRHHAPHAGLIVDVPGIDIVMPFDRPLYQAPTTVDVVSSISASDDAADPDLLFTQSYVDPHRLAQSIRAIVPPRSTVLLSDVIALYPIEQGAAEIVGYLALDADDLDIEVDAAAEALLEYGDPDDPGTTRRVRLPRVTVHRR